MTVQGPVKKQQPDGMSHRGGGGDFGQGIISWGSSVLKAGGEIEGCTRGGGYAHGTAAAGGPQVLGPCLGHRCLSDVVDGCGNQSHFWICEAFGL